MTSPHVHDLRFTAAEFEKLALAGALDKHVELREGTIVKRSPSYVPHGFVHGELLSALASVARSADLSLQVLGQVTLDLGAYFQPMPDIVVWDRKALDELPKTTLPGRAVRLIVEVSDATLADDLGPKLTSYARAGMPEYWVADVSGRRLLLHSQPNGDVYEHRETYPFGAAVQALTLPLIVDTSSLLEV